MPSINVEWHGAGLCLEGKNQKMGSLIHCVGNIYYQAKWRCREKVGYIAQGNGQTGGIKL